MMKLISIGYLMKIKIISVIVLLILGVTVILPSCSSLGTLPDEIDEARFQMSPNFDSTQKVFINRDKDAFERMEKREKFKEVGIIDFFFGNKNQSRPEKPLPVLRPLVSLFLEKSDDVKVIWFGHSTLLLNVQGKIILIDPILSKYSSPVPFVVSRFQKAPLSKEELPEIDIVLISHDHYDHLDMDTIKFFRDKKTRFMVPLGVGSFIRGWGIEKSRISELDWWQSMKDEDLEFIATPAQHFSGRTFSARNKTLWAGWIIKSQSKKIFYSGDSGYDVHFQEIGKKYGPFDIAFMENGQYNKAWEEVHLMPEQGVKAFQELNAKVYFPVHWGAFKLSTHSWFEPIQLAYKFSVEKHFPIIAPKIGEIISIDENYKQVQWWEDFIVNP